MTKATGGFAPDQISVTRRGRGEAVPTDEASAYIAELCRSDLPTRTLEVALAALAGEPAADTARRLDVSTAVIRRETAAFRQWERRRARTNDAESGARTLHGMAAPLRPGVPMPEEVERILNAFLDVSSDGIMFTDGDSRILLFSRGAETIFGYAAEEVLGRSVEALIPQKARARHADHIRRFEAGAVSSRLMGNRRGVSGLTKSGESILLEIGLSKIEAPGGRMFAVVLRDVTAQRAAEAERENQRLKAEAVAEELRQKTKEAQAASVAKSSFLAAMSHEIRTPLNGVLGMAQAMAMDELSPRQRERLSLIRQSGDALLAILNDLLDIAKIEAGKLDLETTEFDLREVVESAHAVFAGLAAAKGLEFELTVAPEANGVCRGDPLRLRQILNNLISNALKFTESGTVAVAVARDPDGLLSLRVTDTGIGISPRKIGMLFNKFEQGDTSTTRRFGGTGLGLAIVRDLAQLMGGSVKVSSRVGKGTAFEVLLDIPRVADAMEPIAPEPAPIAVQGQGLRVLVAEDNRTNQLVLMALLNQIGIEPTVVDDGRGAVEAWDAQSWDLILMDVQMPQMDGLTATGIIRAREAAEDRPRTRIVALTANAMTHQKTEYLRAGIDDVIPKPIEIARLYGAIAAIEGAAAPSASD